jgi:ABC-type lipoprotein export system ATPase subunit
LIPDPTCALIQLEDVRKVFRTSAGEFVALKNINLCFGQGEYASIMGKSGSGKSTLINMITGIDHPTSGSVRVSGIPVHGMKEGKLAEWRGRNLGIVFQFFQLLPMLTLLENTMLPMDFCNQYAAHEREKRALELLELVGLQDIADKLPAALSGGQQQLAAIARALANDPPLIIADEPTGNLDSRTAEHILDVFDSLVAQSKTVIIVTHDSSLAARAGRRVLISDGELINEAVARAFPELTHPQLLAITNQVTSVRYAPGQPVASWDQPDAGLYIVESGEIEVVRNRPGPAEPVMRLNHGQAFGQLELNEGKDIRLSLRVGQSDPLQALWLSREALNSFLQASPSAEVALQQAAVEVVDALRPQSRLNRWVGRRP